jgi:hypothetical protein
LDAQSATDVVASTLVAVEVVVIPVGSVESDELDCVEIVEVFEIKVLVHVFKLAVPVGEIVLNKLNDELFLALVVATTAVFDEVDSGKVDIVLTVLLALYAVEVIGILVDDEFAKVVDLLADGEPEEVVVSSVVLLVDDMVVEVTFVVAVDMLFGVVDIETEGDVDIIRVDELCGVDNKVELGIVVNHASAVLEVAVCCTVEAVFSGVFVVVLVLVAVEVIDVGGVVVLLLGTVELIASTVIVVVGKRVELVELMEDKVCKEEV